jgi:hypothetical protein
MVTAMAIPKFIGDKLGVDIMEFIACIKKVQLSEDLSEAEVIDLLLSHTFYYPNDYLQQLVSVDMPLELIFNHLKDQYTRISPHKANQIIFAFKANKNHNLKSLIKDLTALKNLAPKDFISQYSERSDPLIMNFIKSLPYISRKFARNKLNRLTRTWKPNLTWKEFANSFTSNQTWRIGKDIKYNGIDPSVARSTSIYTKDHKEDPRCTKKNCLKLAERNDTKHYASLTGEEFPINSSISCTDSFVIYSIQCKKCNQQYIGQTTNPICSRYSQHLNDINKRHTNKSIPNHFVNNPGCNVNDMIFSPFEKIFVEDRKLLNDREKHWIMKKETKKRGLNRKC